MQYTFSIKEGKSTPLDEQETIITYDKQMDEWHFYSDNPVHCKRWEKLIIPSDKYPSTKTYHEKTNQLIKIEGKVNGTASISKKRTMSREQKEAASKRMKSLHEQNRL